MLKQESFLCLSFNPFYSLKCVQGAGENELVPAPCLAFLSITEDPQRRSEKLKQTEVRLLAVLCKIIVSPLDPLYFFIAFPYFACFLLPCPCSPLRSFLIFYSLYCSLLHAHFFFFFSHLLSHFLPSSLILTSTLLLLFWFI